MLVHFTGKNSHKSFRILSANFTKREDSEIQGSVDFESLPAAANVGGRCIAELVASTLSICGPTACSILVTIILLQSLCDFIVSVYVYLPRHIWYISNSKQIKILAHSQVLCCVSAEIATLEARVSAFSGGVYLQADKECVLLNSMSWEEW